MNRQLKFRIWNLKSKKMIYKEDWLAIGLNGRLIEHNFWHDDDSEDVWNDWLDQKDYIIQQFTGLTDKNGKEIYEGDLIRFDKRGYASDDMNFVIKFGQYSCPFGEGYETDKECGFFAETVVLPCYIDSIALSNRIQVIGNIFETPELLKNFI